MAVKHSPLLVVAGDRDGGCENAAAIMVAAAAALRPVGSLTEAPLHWPGGGNGVVVVVGVAGRRESVKTAAREQHREVVGW